VQALKEDVMKGVSVLIPSFPPSLLPSLQLDLQETEERSGKPESGDRPSFFLLLPRGGREGGREGGSITASTSQQGCQPFSAGNKVLCD
jgi:hypothetical protein